MVEPITIISLFIVGILVAILAAIVGIGGGLVFVPALIFIYGINPIDATLISSFAIVFVSSSGFIRYRFDKKIDYKTAGIYLLLALPGSFLGGYVAERIDESLMRTLFAILIGLSAIRGIYKAYYSKDDDLYLAKHIGDETKEEQEVSIERNLNLSTQRRIVDRDGMIYDYEVRIGIGMLFAALGGFVGGLLGVGGGIIFTPLLNVITGVPIHISTATSTTMIVLVSIVAVITRFADRAATGDLDLLFILSYGVPLAAGAIFGAFFGASRAKSIKPRQLIILFWIVALFAAVRMILN